MADAADFQFGANVRKGPTRPRKPQKPRPGKPGGAAGGGLNHSSSANTLTLTS